MTQCSHENFTLWRHPMILLWHTYACVIKAMSTFGVRCDVTLWHYFEYMCDINVMSCCNVNVTMWEMHDVMVTVKCGASMISWKCHFVTSWYEYYGVMVWYHYVILTWRRKICQNFIISIGHPCDVTIYIHESRQCRKIKITVTSLFGVNARTPLMCQWDPDIICSQQISRYTHPLMSQ